ncbi:MAG: hypothetical protein HQ530_04910 [Parcubacteria group bacterium]|nr:hypothetical protein [Parcubacteria group bacterium]
MPQKRLTPEELEEKYGEPSTRTVKREKEKRAPQGQTKSGLAQRIKTNKGFQRSSRQPKIKIVDKTKE